MAIVTRTAGDANPVVHVDPANGKPVSIGIGKSPTAFKITLAAAGDAALGGNVETVLRILAVKATTIAYQIDGTKLSVLVEATGWVDDAELLAALGALATAVDSSAGFSLA